MNVSSVIIRTRPEFGASVGATLGAWPGVGVHAITADGRIVATLEDSSTGTAADMYVRLHDVVGVFSVSMVYQYSDESKDEELP
jgi:nitrate reductase NapD